MNNKVIRFVSPGVAELQNTAVREPSDGEVLVKILASTISSGTERANLVGEVNVSCCGNDTAAHFPRTPGYSSAGIVEKTGAGVHSVKPGDRVALSWSVHSAYCTLPGCNVHKIISDDISFNEAALFHISTFPTAAIRKCRLELGESALVMGLGVLGTIVVTTKEDIAAVLKEELENGHGVDVAIDCLGGEIMGKCIHYLTHGARWIMIAALAGQKTEIDLKNIYVRNVRIVGSTLRSRTPAVKAKILADLVRDVWPKVSTGEVRPTIYKVLPITEAEAAQDIFYRGENVGKVVLTV